MQDKTASPVLRNARRIVVKVGSSLVNNEGRGLDAAAIGCICLMAIVAIFEERKIRREKKNRILQTA